MTQEDKQLILKDLCSRLSYRPMCSIFRVDDFGVGWRDEVLNGFFKDEKDYEFYFGDMFAIDDVTKIKLYLRPMSSMTEEEKEELRQEEIKDEQLFADCIKNHPEMRGLIIPHFAADWCNKKMFDYRCLITKGLALEAPKGMYKEEQQ